MDGLISKYMKQIKWKKKRKFLNEVNEWEKMDEINAWNK